LKKPIEIPFVYWGGEPIKRLASTPGFLPEDRRILEQWATFISNPAVAGPRWLAYQSTGRTWLDLSSCDGRRRLFLKPFYVTRRGERPLWYFAGFALPVQESGIWAGVIASLARTTREDVEAAGAYFTSQLTAFSKSPKPIVGNVFKGDYESALNQLCEAVSSSSMTSLLQAQVASHPPEAHRLFTTLILADDYCYPGIQLLSSPTFEDVALKQNSRNQIGNPSGEGKIHKLNWLPWSISGLCVVTLIFMSSERSRLRRELELIQSRVKEEEYLRKKAETAEKVARGKLKSAHDQISSLPVEASNAETQPGSD
jgi:hypothetical protein